MEDIIRTLIASKNFNEIRNLSKVLDIKQDRHPKKQEIIDKIVRGMKRRAKVFKDDITKRKGYKKYFDEFDIKFKENVGFEKRERKNKVYKNVKRLFKTETQSYTINESFGRYIKKYKTTEKIYTVYGDNLHAFSTIIRKIFNKAITKPDGTRFRDSDKINITAMHPRFQIPIRSKNIPISEAFDVFLDSLANKMEYKDCNINEVEFHFYIIELPIGGSEGLKIIKEDDLKIKRSIIRIKNNDNLCLARSIVTALAVKHSDYLSEKLNIDKLTDIEIKYIKMGRKLQKDLSEKLHDFCNIPKEICSLKEVKEFENILDIQIFIFDRDNFYKKIYNGETNKDIFIYLYKDNNHFNVITSITGFLGKRNYCRFCDRTFEKEHKCNRKCNCCFQEGKCDGNDFNYKDCFRIFKGQGCFDNHKNENVCERLWKCQKCKVNIRRQERDPETHRCGEKMCKNCREFVMEDHLCYIKPRKTKGGYCKKGCKDREKCINCRTFTEKYLFFDLETDQSSGKHKVNLAICQDFEGKDFMFKTNEEFCKWLFDRRHSGYTVLAHYGKGLDFQFLAKYCINNGLKPFTIYNGNKIQFMEIKVLNLRFIDSINFMQIPLREFPKTFGLTELKKGYFPHYFNIEENQNYVGTIPEEIYFGYNQMSKKQREDFDRWYDPKRVFDFKKEFIEYCRSDVDILRRSCLEFRKLFLDTFNIDPFCYITLSSVCMAIFKGNFLKEEVIGIDEEIYQKDTFSKKSIAWLDYISETKTINIRHALNGGEKKIGKYKVDGYCKDSKTVYQFHGCFWHGCPQCFKEETINVQNSVCMKDLYDKTIRINNYILKKGYNLVTLWEHEFSKDMKKYLNREFIEPLNPRDAFYGGRCEPTKLKYETKEGEKIRYIIMFALCIPR